MKSNTVVIHQTSFLGRLRARRWTWAHRLSQAGFLALLLASRYLEVNWLAGSASSTKLLGVLHLADPFGALEVMLASRQISLSLLIAAGIILILYALLGRVFCGWICPLGLVLDLTDDVRQRFVSRKRGKQMSRQIKYVLLGIFLVLSLLIGLPAFTLVSPINILTRNLIFGFGPEILLVVGIVAVDLFYSRRAWCRYLCPLGAFYSLLGRFAIFHVRIRNQGEACTMHAHCTRSCPMGINVLKGEVLAKHTVITDPECTRCGVCIEGCEGELLNVGLAPPKELSKR